MADIERQEELNQDQLSIYAGGFELTVQTGGGNE